MNLATCATHQHGDRNGVLDRVRVHGRRTIRADMEGVKANLTPVAQRIALSMTRAPMPGGSTARYPAPPWAPAR